MDISFVDMSTPASLTPATFHILLALSEEQRHGLGIADEVERASEGAISLGPGTLYRSLKEMTRKGLIIETKGKGGHVDPRRKFYRMTPAGRRALASEARLLDRIVRVARGRNVLPEETS